MEDSYHHMLSYNVCSSFSSLGFCQKEPNMLFSPAFQIHSFFDHVKNLLFIFRYFIFSIIGQIFILQHDTKLSKHLGFHFVC